MPGSRLKETKKGTDGLLLVDKPAGVSSHDVVAVARRALKEKRIGHAGTLDPFATGLLVLLVGRATRLAQYVPDEPKQYDAIVRFGNETDSEDASGSATVSLPLPARAALESARANLIGNISQVPPAYSAKHVDGERAYEIARRGEAVVLAPVAVTVHSLALSEFETDSVGMVLRCRMRVSCAGGTYVRSLARDLARAAGSAAHLETLRRHSAGVFSLARSIPLEQLRDQPETVTLAPAIDALEGLPLQPVDAAEVAALAKGAHIVARVPGERAALIDAQGGGALVALAERLTSAAGDRWQPRVVMINA